MKNFLTPLQKKFLSSFQKSDLNKHYYWSGGTALSYFYLQHRLSEDLDFFSNELFFDEYMATEFLKLKKAVGAAKMIEQKRLNRHQLFFEVKKEILKVEFVYYPFQTLGKQKTDRTTGVKIDSLKDIAVNKMHAVFERSEPKDIFDLYWIIQKGKFKFLGLFKWVEKKFGSNIDPAAFSAKILSNIVSLEKIKPLMLNNALLNAEKIKKFFEQQTLAFLRKRIK